MSQVISGKLNSIAAKQPELCDLATAPTGSGKTVLFELAIVKMLRASSGTGRKAKCVYIAPTKVYRVYP